ncbi:MAG: hypothetical protein K6E91_07420 [Butyrivibrio sp.]|nr:hypothetical protein [Butyrivibrio sp.]
MNKKNLTAVISAVSVFTMFMIGTVMHTYEYAWLAVPAGGVLIAIVSMLRDNNEDQAEGKR